MVLLLALAGLAGAWAVSAAGSPPDAARHSVSVGRRAPDFAMPDVDGRSVSLARLRGHGVWLSFGATWCTACRIEAPDMDRIARTTPGLSVVSIYLREDRATVADFTDRLGLGYRQVPDPAGELAATYGARSLPFHVFIGADGTIRDVRAGSLSPAQMRRSAAAVATP